MTDIPSLIRKNILSLVPYSSARDEFTGKAAILLDANENPLNPPLNRYPDPRQTILKQRISEIKGIPVSGIFLGNGSDEAIDLLFRVFCEPNRDNALSIWPTYGMYKVCAGINSVEMRDVLLTGRLQIDPEALLSMSDEFSKLLFLCSPNNPTSNSLSRNDMLSLCRRFRGLVVVDEAYIDFSDSGSLLPELGEYPNLVILQTLSKAWGMAGIRLGMAFAHSQVIEAMHKIKYPYNINLLTQQCALQQLEKIEQKNQWVALLIEQRKWLAAEMNRLAIVNDMMPSDANFLMVKFDKPEAVFSFLNQNGIVVRDRSKLPLCQGYLRITVGTPAENQLLVQKLQEFS